jgi:hypothetical protein
MLCRPSGPSVHNGSAKVIHELRRNWRVVCPQKREDFMLRLVLLIILILAILGSVPMWGYSTGWGYGPSGGLGLVLLIVLILILVGRI